MIALLPILMCGCSSTWTTYGLFTRPELRTKVRFAVLGLDPEQEQVLMSEFLHTFGSTNITFVETQQVRSILGKQDYVMGGLNEVTRSRLRESLGVEAVIVCDYAFTQSETANTGDRKLRVKIIDSESSSVIGSVVVSRDGSRTDSLTDFRTAARQAVTALRDHTSSIGYY